MHFANQSTVRSEIKKYFDMAANGEPIYIPRKDGRAVVIVSEEEYTELLNLKNNIHRKRKGNNE